MKFSNIIKVSSMTALTICSQAIFAHELILPCPTVDLVTQVWKQMDNAIPNDLSYIVTSKPIVNFANQLWSIRTIVPAHNQTDAIKLAK